MIQREQTVVSDETIYDGKIVHLHLKTVRMANGHQVKREVVEHDGAVCIVALRSDGKVLLVRQYRLPAQRELLEAPAGMVEKGEDPAACAHRELEEETGYTAQEMQPLGQFFLAPGYSTELMHAFLATGLTETHTNPDEDEDLELVAVPSFEIEGIVRAGRCEDAKTIAALLLALPYIRATG